MDHMNLTSFEMDHSSHVHGGMDHMEMHHHSGHVDHMAHNHSVQGHNMNMHGSMHGSMHDSMHMMLMYFHFGHEEVVLFDFWKISSVGGLVLSMIGIFILAALYEGLKYFREYLFWKTYNNLQYRSVQMPVDKTPSESSSNSRVVNCVAEVLHRTPPTIMSPNHFIQTFLHIIQITVSYFLMLIFMTYNIWLCLAVVLGAGTGYFLFGWKKSVVVDVTEHCH